MVSVRTIMNIPAADIAAAIAPLRTEIDAAIARVLDSCRFIGGPEVEAFERELAAAAGVGHIVAVSSGTDALLIALMALGVGPGDEVVTTPFTFFATAGAVARLGARLVFADIEETSFNLDPHAAARAIGDKTKVVIPVHLFGRPAATVDVPPHVRVVEDAAQALGAAELTGACATHSFFPSKNLGGAGDGGAVATRDPALAERLHVLRNHGAKPKYFHALVGGNFRLDALQAAILRVKLPQLNSWIAKRREAAARYRALFGATPVPPELALPEHTDDHTYNQFVIRAPKRDALRDHLRSAGIATAIYYPRPLHLQECFSDLGYRAGSLRVAERVCEEVLALPIFPTISEPQQQHVVEQIAGFYD